MSVQLQFLGSNDFLYLAFSRDGNLGANNYLEIGNTLTSNAGYVLQGTYKLLQMQFSNANALANGAIIGLRYRTARTTFVDVTNARITVANTGYKASNTYDILLTENAEIAAYQVSGTTTSNSILLIKLQRM